VSEESHVVTSFDPPEWATVSATENGLVLHRHMVSLVMPERGERSLSVWAEQHDRFSATDAGVVAVHREPPLIIVGQDYELSPAEALALAEALRAAVELVS
jgi:hypothetical protein